MELDLSQILASYHQKASNISDAIDAQQALLADTEEVIAELERLSSQSTFTIEEINYLLAKKANSF